MRFQIIIRLIILTSFLLPPTGIKAQSVKQTIAKAKALIDNRKYKEGYNILQEISESQASECGDSCSMLYNYGKGASLYFMDRYEEAIPFLQKSISFMENLPHEDCNFLEMFYGIGACYKKLGNYPKAEEYFRKTILKGNDSKFLNCAIRNQTYREMAELYSLMGMPEFSDICTSRIESEMRLKGQEDIDNQINVLLDVADSYAKNGNEEECVRKFKEILDLIKNNKGKMNDDYLLYARLLSSKYKYDFNKPLEASKINKEIIEIGKKFKTTKENVARAYYDYLNFLASQGKKDSIELILPEAVKYCSSVKIDRNLYEDIGIGFCDANEKDEAVKYFEKEWKGKTANTILALTFLSDYYFKSNPEKSITYIKQAESKINNGLNVNDNTKQFVYEYQMYLNERLTNYQEAIRYAELAEPFILKNNDKKYYIRHLMSWAVDCVHVDNKENALNIITKVKPLIEQADDKTKISTYSDMGFVYILTEKYDDAIIAAKSGIEISLEKEGEKYPYLTTLYHNLGRAYMLKEDYANALSAFYKSKDLQLELKGELMQRTADYIKECESK